MKIDKAIERLEAKFIRSGYEADTPSQEALKLGIEALKRERAIRQGSPHLQLDLLPGETEE